MENSVTERFKADERDPFSRLWKGLSPEDKEDMLEKVHGYRREPEYWKLSEERSK